MFDDKDFFKASVKVVREQSFHNDGDELTEE